MDPIWSILLMLRPWMSYNYTVIQVICWVELLEQRRLCLIFCGNMNPDKWDTIVWYRVTRNHRNSTVDELSTGPQDLGHHSLVSELRLTIT